MNFRQQNSTTEKNFNRPVNCHAIRFHFYYCSNAYTWLCN